MTEKEKAAPGVSTGAALKVLLPSAILTEDEAACTIPKVLQIWRYCHGYSSHRATAAAFKTHPEWRGA